MTLKTVLTMGVFDKFFNLGSSIQTYSPKSEQEAWIAIMYASMEIDGYISETEIRKLFQILGQQNLFKNKHIADYYQPAMLAHRKVGSKKIIDCSIPFIQNHNKPVLFALIMQLLLADGILGKTEKEIARYLTHVFDLELSEVRQVISDMLGKR